MLCNMDKLNRFFDIVPMSDEDAGDWNSLRMLSGYQGEFGPVSLMIEADLDSKDFAIHCRFVQTSGEDFGRLFYFRTHELGYFVSQILPLFNPQTFKPDAFTPFIPPQEKPSNS